MDSQAGFADRRFVMIHGDYYRTNNKANEHRRPILVQAWFAEFVDMVTNEVLLNKNYQSPKIKNATVYAYIKKFGAFEIFKKNVGFLKNTKTYFVRVRPADNQKLVQDQFVDILNDVKEKRNKGTHQKIDKDFLREMLERMIDFCKLLKTYRMETEKSELFQAQCQSEVANIEIDENPENPENPLY